MYLIEKCIRNDVYAAFDINQRHLWAAAWRGGKSRVDGCSLDDAIEQFHKLTVRVRTAPYRLRDLNSGIVVAAINAIDADNYQKFRIHAVHFGLNESVDPAEANGVVVPGAVSIAVGSARTKNAEVVDVITKAANELSQAILSHKVLIRYNSHGESGGAFLVTSALDGVMANADIGISYSMQSKEITLSVANKFLKNPSIGNSRCPFTGLMDYKSAHVDVSSAVEDLVRVCKQATGEEIDYLMK